MCMRKDNYIYAVVGKPYKNKYYIKFLYSHVPHPTMWDTFKFNTSVQSYVENFMIYVFHNRSYALYLERDLKDGLVGSKFLNGHRLNITEVKVSAKKSGTTYTIK